MFKTLNHLVLVAATSTALIVPLTASIVKAASVTLSYNGDLDPTAGQGFSNGVNTNSPGTIYEDFTVPTTQDWIIDTVLSNNQMNFTSNLATWEIRAGVSSGNGGTLIAGNQNATASQVATGRSVAGNPEYTIAVTGLNVTLTPGTYWVAITPVAGSLGNQSYLSYTSGANAVGKPASKLGNSFFSNSGGFSFQPVSDLGVSSFTNFSIGVKGTVTAATPVPFEFSPTLGIIIFGVLTAIAKPKLGQRK